ncbi:hypothetical protein SLE2022_088770 [Rubroshorea leprosula]
MSPLLSVEAKGGDHILLSNMDYVSPVLSFDQNTDDLFESFSFPSFEPDELFLALPEDTDFLSNKTNNCTGCVDSGSNTGRRKAPETPSGSGANKDVNPPDNKKKKIKHREIERQRRQEMATLYGALKSLLPPDYLKGKRSISDHMNQAVRYINDLQRRIAELNEKRNELKRLSSSCSSSFVPQCLQGCPDQDTTVTVRPCLGRGGVEVVISTALSQGLPLSSVIQVLIAEGLRIANCISTRVDERLMHTVVSEVSVGRVVDPSALQKKLEELAFHSSRLDFVFDLLFD